jgi:hypothetical protein
MGYEFEKRISPKPSASLEMQEDSARAGKVR